MTPCEIVDFEIKEKKRKERQVLTPSQRTKKLWNIKVTVITIVIGAVGTIPQN